MPPLFHCFNPLRSQLGWIWSTNRRHLPTFCWDRNKPTAGDSCDWFQRDFTAKKSYNTKCCLNLQIRGFHPGFQFIVSYRLPLEDWLGSHQSPPGGLQLWHLCAVFAPAHGVTGTDPEADCIACISNKGFSWKVQLSNQAISIKFMNQPLNLKKYDIWYVISDIWYMICDVWYIYISVWGPLTKKFTRWYDDNAAVPQWQSNWELQPANMLWYVNVWKDQCRSISTAKRQDPDLKKQKWLWFSK